MEFVLVTLAPAPRLRVTKACRRSWGVKAPGLAGHRPLGQPAQRPPRLRPVPPLTRAGDEQRTRRPVTHVGVHGLGGPGSQGHGGLLATLPRHLEHRWPRSTSVPSASEIRSPFSPSKSTKAWVRGPSAAAVLMRLPNSSLSKPVLWESEPTVGAADAPRPPGAVEGSNLLNGLA